MVWARWSVMWIKDGRVIEKKFGHEFMDALDFFAKVKASGRAGVTLRCTNMGHPPPRRVTHHVEYYVETVRVTRGKYRGRRVKVQRKRYVNLMGKYNDQGIFWCPYCMKLRPFKQRTHATYEGIEWAISRREVVMECPMCKISTKDAHVKRYNPKAIVFSYHQRVRRTKSERRRRRTRRSR